MGELAIAVFFGRQRGDGAAAEKAERILGEVERMAKPDGAPLLDTFGWADASVIAALGYLTFRLGEGWRARFPNTAAWFDRMDERPSAVATRPRM